MLQIIEMITDDMSFIAFILSILSISFRPYRHIVFAIAEHPVWRLMWTIYTAVFSISTPYTFYQLLLGTPRHDKVISDIILLLFDILKSHRGLKLSTEANSHNQIHQKAFFSTLVLIPRESTDGQRQKHNDNS